jgi:hypothetical protein
MNPFKLKIRWSNRDKDFIVTYPRKSDGSWILNRIIGKRTETGLVSNYKDDVHATELCGVDWNENIKVYIIDFIAELESRGFDKASLKFEVTIDLNKIDEKFSHLLENSSKKDMEWLARQKRTVGKALATSRKKKSTK